MCWSTACDSGTFVTIMPWFRIDIISQGNTVQDAMEHKLFETYYISGFLQIRILINVLLASGYQPSLTKIPEHITYFSMLNLPFLPQITNEKITDICFVLVRILLYTCRYITHLLYSLCKMSTSIGFTYFYHEDIPNVQHVGNGWRR